MPIRLRDNLHWCLCNGRAIFLDIEADRYFGLPPELEPAFARLAAGEMEPGDQAGLSALFRRGLLIDGPASSGFSLGSIVEPATGDLLVDPYSAPPVRAVINALASELRASWLLQTRPFADLVDFAGSPVPRWRRQPADLGAWLRAMVSASMTTSLLLPTKDRCLARGLAVHSTCRRHGVSSKLVFGVRSNPFTAHCWVQFSSKVLVGDFEQVRLFTPILAVG